MDQREQRLLRLSQVKLRDSQILREGVSLEADLGRPIADLQHQVVADRMALASNFLQMATRMKSNRSDLARPTIARYYYAMYQAMRAVVYFSFGGDDHEAHSKLHLAIPQDFPNQSTASNDLKNARSWRNEADYDPYPVSSAYFRQVANILGPIAEPFVADCQTYLKSKGNPHL